MGKKKLNERVGEVVTNESGTYTLIEYIDANHVTIQKDDGTIIKTSYSKFKNNKNFLNENEKPTAHKNIYDLNNLYGICYASNTKEPILFDLEDYDIIKNRTWRVVHYNGGYKRAVCTIKGKQVAMQNLILNTKYLDHINSNSLDNRKSNLRPSFDSDGYNRNSLNTKLTKANTSGHKGVFFLKTAKKKKWRGNITYKNKTYGKSFENYEEACAWVDNKRLELHGEFANCG